MPYRARCWRAISSRRSSSFIVLGLIARSDFPCADTSVGTPYVSQSNPCFIIKSLTPVVLLLLVVVSKFAFPLCSHAAFGLHHLLRFVQSWLVPLAGVEILQIGYRLGAHMVVVTTNGMVALRDATHTRRCMPFQFLALHDDLSAYRTRSKGLARPLEALTPFERMG